MRSIKKLLSAAVLALAMSSALVAPAAQARVMADGCYFIVSESGQLLGILCCTNDYCSVRWA